MPRTDDWFSEPDELEQTSETWDYPLERRRARRRLAVSATLVMLFFAGAAVTAVGGDVAATQLEDETCVEMTNTSDTACAEQSADAAAPAAADPAEDAAPADDPAAADAAPATDAAPTEPAPTDAADEAAEPQATNVGTAHAAAAAAHAADPNAAPQTTEPAAPKADAEPVLKPVLAPAIPLRVWSKPTKHVQAPQPEIEGPGVPTVWLNRALPDPTPPASRLTMRFAAQLSRTSKAQGVSWALVLGVLRASGENGAVPATKAEVRTLASRLASLGAARDEWQAVLAFDGHTEFADRAVALANYDRAVGLWALVHGLEAAKDAITERLLDDPQVMIYTGGRGDLADGHIDVRVVVLIAYMRETFGEVTVTSLISGHRLYARPGVISAHVYGHAVDIAAVANTSIYGHQEPGGVTERAVRAMLLLPSELQPRQVISLIGLGGPSFPLADHDDHIHVGY